MWKALEDEKKATGKSMSRIVSEALEEHVEARRAWVQARLTDYSDEFAAKIESLRREFVSPNPKRYPDWRSCLEGEGLLTEEVLAYSLKRGWKV
jgi:pantothenate kinase-related protein Tda10